MSITTESLATVKGTHATITLTRTLIYSDNGEVDYSRYEVTCTDSDGNILCNGPSYFVEGNNGRGVWHTVSYAPGSTTEMPARNAALLDFGMCIAADQDDEWATEFF